MLGNFVGSLTSAIGSTLSSGFSQVAGSLLSGVPGLGNVLSSLMGQQYDCSVMQDVLDNQVYGQAPNREFSNVSLRDLINRNIPSNWGTDAMAKVLSNAGVLQSIDADIVTQFGCRDDFECRGRWLKLIAGGLFIFIHSAFQFADKTVFVRMIFNKLLYD